MAFSLVVPNPLRVRAEQALFGLFLLLLVLFPLPLGSVVPVAWGTLGIAIYALVLAWLLLWASGRAAAPDALRAAGLPLAILGFWTLLQALHVVPLPRAWVAAVSPDTARIHGLLDALGPTAEVIRLSVDPYASQSSLLKTLAYSGAFFLTLALVNTRSRIRLLARVLVYSALVHSVYAVLAHLSGAETQYLGARISHGAQASGYFVNRNHFAGYLEMTLAIGIGLLIAGLSDRRADSWKEFAKQTVEWVLSPKMFLRLSLCILVIALTTTHSRMGNTGFFASLLIAGVIGIVLSRHATRNTVVLLASLVVIDLLIVGSWFGVERLVQRLEQTTVEEIQVRETPANYAVAMVERNPVFGVGPGSFYVAFEPFRPDTVVDYYDFAHNDYVQFAAESGLLGIGLIGLFVVVALLAALRAQRTRRDPLMRGMSFACLMGVTAILIHSSADFNLQIPSNAVYFMVLLALGWISLSHGRSDVGES
jgi:O-antigen ligase